MVREKKQEEDLGVERGKKRRVKRGRGRGEREREGQIAGRWRSGT